MKVLKSIGIMFLMLLVASLFISAAGAQDPAQDATTVVILESIGGTTDPPVGTNTLFGDVTLTATPSTGYVFSYWLYEGPELAHNLQGGAQRTFSDNPLSIGTDAAGYTVTWQAVFVPEGAASLQPSGIGVGYVILLVVVVAAVVGALGFIGARLRK